MTAAAGGTYEDTEGLINLPLTVRDIRGVGFLQGAGADRVPGEPALQGRHRRRRPWPRQFGGGGHKNAAGLHGARHVRRGATGRGCRHRSRHRGRPGAGARPAASTRHEPAKRRGRRAGRRAGGRQAGRPDQPRRRGRRAAGAGPAADRPHRHARPAGDRRAGSVRRRRDAAGAVSRRRATRPTWRRFSSARPPARYDAAGEPSRHVRGPLRWTRRAVEARAGVDSGADSCRCRPAVLGQEGGRPAGLRPGASATQPVVRWRAVEVDGDRARRWSAVDGSRVPTCGSTCSAGFYVRVAGPRPRRPRWGSARTWRRCAASGADDSTLADSVGAGPPDGGPPRRSPALVRPMADLLPDWPALALLSRRGRAGRPRAGAGRRRATGTGGASASRAGCA